MTPLVFALAQYDFVVGALRPNAEKMARVANELYRKGADIAVFPELSLSGYPPEDLVLKPHFIGDAETELQHLARSLPAGLITLVGTPVRTNGRIYNAAAVLAQGRLQAVYRKALLPNYGVFDEQRLFVPGRTSLVLDIEGRRIGVQICEDSWVPGAAPCGRLAAAGVDAVVNLSASPFHRRKSAERRAALAAAARRIGAPLLYCNLVGGQDELVFDGASLALTEEGRTAARARSFREDILWYPLLTKGAAAKPRPSLPARVRLVTLPVISRPARADVPETRVAKELDEREEVYEALMMGLRDYMDKNGFGKAVVAVSGGVDSALVATLAVDALGPERVTAVTMPSRFSSTDTRTDAVTLAENLGIPLLTLPIQRLFETALEELAPHGIADGDGTTPENLQARIRGLLIMALSNRFGWLVLSTGNKSELATGYCTLYGDMVGGFALIKDVPKTLVFELCRWRNQRADRPVIPPTTIERPPSAELRENQRDDDSLPLYEDLDPILERYVERDLRFDAIVADGFDPDTVTRVIHLVDTAEYKRRQGAPGVKITPRAFGRDRRMPITNLYRDRPHRREPTS